MPTRRVYTHQVSTLPTVPGPKRREILASDRGRAANPSLESQLGVFECVEVQAPPEPRGSLPETLRIAAWNLERGRFVAEAALLLSQASVEVALLSELDVGMARTGQRHTARELAAALGHGFVYAVEFVELGLGDPAEQKRHAGDENSAGIHGAAITSAWPLERPAVLRFDAGGDWLDGQRGEPRVGGRIALLATLRIAGLAIAVAAVHLESHSDPAHRASQMSVLLDALDAYSTGGPAIIGGDLNTLSMPSANLASPELLRTAHREDPERLLHPERHEPLFQRAREAGFEWSACNVANEGSVRREETEGSRRLPVRLDWLLTRGVHCFEPGMIDALDPVSGRALSDHEGLVVTIGRKGRDSRSPRSGARG